VPPAWLIIAKVTLGWSAEAPVRLSSFEAAAMAPAPRSKVKAMTARRAGCATAAAASESPKANAPRRGIPIDINPRSFATCQKFKRPNFAGKFFRDGREFSYIKTQFNTKNYFGLSFSHHLHTNCP
jgi:hypothetical protein